MASSLALRYPSTFALLDTIDSSNMSRNDKSKIAQVFDKITNGAASKFIESRGMGMHTLEASVGVIRQSTEAAFMGGVLGMVHAKFGLDLFGKKVPIDGAAYLLLTLAGVACSGREIGTDLRNMGGTCISVLAFRKSNDLFAAAKLRGSPAASVAGESDMGVDPIEASARNL